MLTGLPTMRREDDRHRPRQDSKAFAQTGNGEIFWKTSEVINYVNKICKSQGRAGR